MIRGRKTIIVYHPSLRDNSVLEKERMSTRPVYQYKQAQEIFFRVSILTINNYPVTMKHLIVFALFALICMARSAPAVNSMKVFHCFNCFNLQPATTPRELILPDYHEPDDDIADDEIHIDTGAGEEDEEEEDTTTTTTTTTTRRSPYVIPTRNRNIIPSRRPYLVNQISLRKKSLY